MILSEIQKWAEKQPVWQQHAVAVLYERPTPLADDLEDILALFQESHGIPNLIGREARKLTKEQVAAPQAGQPLFQLAAIKNLQYVNALAPRKTLSLAPTGLTNIYGDNGVGKSGYTRVLKKACLLAGSKFDRRGHSSILPFFGRLEGCWVPVRHERSATVHAPERFVGIAYTASA